MFVTSHMEHETLTDEGRVLCRVPTYIVGTLYCKDEQLRDDTAESRQLLQL